MYNFSGAKAATANAYLNPGIYRLKVTEVKQDKFTKGTPFIGFKFENEEGVSFIEKFQFGTEKGLEVSISRLQYLHEGFFNKPCAKDFKTLEEITAYFHKALTTKPISKLIVVGGNENGNNVFASLPFSGFILDDDADVEQGEFEKGSPEWKKVVKKSNQTSEVADKPNGLLNDAEDASEIGAGKQTEKKADKAKAPKAEKPAVSKEDEDMPW